MKIGHHKQMMSFLTRPDTRSKEERKLMESKQTAAEITGPAKQPTPTSSTPVVLIYLI